MMSWKSLQIGIRETEQLKTAKELYEMEIHQKMSMPNFHKKKMLVKRRRDQKLRLRNFDARHGNIETGAVVKNRKGSSGVERGKGMSYQSKEKIQYSRAVSGMRVMIVHQNRHRKPLHPLSHQ